MELRIEFRNTKRSYETKIQDYEEQIEEYEEELEDCQQKVRDYESTLQQLILRLSQVEKENELLKKSQV